MFEPQRGVEQQHHDFREIDRMARILHRQPLELVVDLGLLAHPRGVDQADGQRLAAFGIGPFPLNRDRIAGDPRFGPDQQAVLAEQPVDQCRFARVGPPDDRQLERAVLLVLFLGRVEIGLIAVEQWQQRLEQIAHALAVFGRHADRLAQPQRERLVQSRIALTPLDLVGDEYHRHLGGPQPARDFLIERGHPGARVDDEQRHRGADQRGLGLRAHPPGQAGGIVVFPACGIDDREVEPEEVRLAHSAITGDARLIVDQRQALADEAVPQRRLADVGTADDDYLGQRLRGHGPGRGGDGRAWQAKRPMVSAPFTVIRRLALTELAHNPQP